jgi:hypothetical protein
VGPERRAIRLSAERGTARIHGVLSPVFPPMIELNPVRQRIADLSNRLNSLRGFL